jgi:hypothetical protein
MTYFSPRALLGNPSEVGHGHGRVLKLSGLLFLPLITVAAAAARKTTTANKNTLFFTEGAARNPSEVGHGPWPAFLPLITAAAATAANKNSYFHRRPPCFEILQKLFIGVLLVLV